MFYDLNVPWSPNDRELQRTIAFLDELGYDVVALTHTLSGKLPAEISCPIPASLPFHTPNSLCLLRRCTLILADTSQNHRIAQIAAAYDILAIRPTDEKTLKQACETLDCEIISIDLTQRLAAHFKFKMLSQAIARGVRFEICYSPGILAVDSSARRNLIGNVTQLIRATRGRGLVISSEAKIALGCRAPADVINLASVWGLGQERGKEAICKEARSVVVTAQLKRTSYRGVVDVVYGGEKPMATPNKGAQGKAEAQKKRKASAITTNGNDGGEKESPKPPSKSDLQRQEKRARFESQKGTGTDIGKDSKIAEDQENTVSTSNVAVQIEN
ncbi:PHP domain-like protein [Lepidopterella palustris CBS 459.81]|uniref:PHP domain-like protein n=1 Tax=Lepidopterella palustris CBS 459.81 TaxID=1314670 RepID=A0A8E2JCN0_9PEZI|nr:PHP domain-like protein [Lepidopterella palustris CBS 459.81]